MAKKLERDITVVETIYVNANNFKKCSEECYFYSYSYCMRYGEIDLDSDGNPMIYRHENCIKDFGL